jgi:hypothetical protein
MERDLLREQIRIFFWSSLLYLRKPKTINEYRLFRWYLFSSEDERLENLY